MRSIRSAVVLAGLLLGFAVTPVARAQFAVIDAASVTQLIGEARTLLKQLQTARSALAEAQAQYRSTTGDRGMQRLLSGIVRNYLPVDAAQLKHPGRSGYVTLADAIAADIHNQAVLSGTQLAALAPGAARQLAAQRADVAQAEALTSEELSNASARFASIQQLIDAIPSAIDQKSILELQARIDAEQGMLQNEQTKLQVLDALERANRRSARQRERELIVAAQGGFAKRFEPTPP